MTIATQPGIAAFRNDGNNGTNVNIRPWFHETTSPNLFNEWTWTHIAWGIAAYRIMGEWLLPIALHTSYELIEGKIFPDPHRDVSNLNHVGDTIAFMFGLWLGDLIIKSNRR